MNCVRFAVPRQPYVFFTIAFFVATLYISLDMALHSTNTFGPWDPLEVLHSTPLSVLTIYGLLRKFFLYPSLRLTLRSVSTSCPHPLLFLRLPLPPSLPSQPHSTSYALHQFDCFTHLHPNASILRSSPTPSNKRKNSPTKYYDNSHSNNPFCTNIQTPNTPLMALAQLHHSPFWAQHGVAGRGCRDRAVPVRELDAPLCGGVPVCSICMNQRANIAG